MLPGLDVAIMAGFLHASAGGISCAVPKPPRVTVTPVTKPVQYDFSRTATELSGMRSDTVNPYGPGADTATGGLRANQMDMKVRVSVGYQQYITGASCLWYDAVEMTIELAPRVYVAKDYGGKGACHDAILAHERRHVQVDREVTNHYAQILGAAIRDTIDRTGVIGPIDKSEIAARQAQLSERIQQDVLARKPMMEAHMRERQAAVDTLAEYERVSKICQKAR